MRDSITKLEEERARIIKELSGLGDFRPGCVTGIIRRCGKKTCRCARPGDPGHGPSPRLTYKSGGRTISEYLSSVPAIRKAEREIAAFRVYQQLSRDFVKVNARICQLRTMRAPASV